MTTNLDMNTFEQTRKDIDINNNQQQYINNSQLQLMQNQIRRKHGRDYGRILHEYNNPPQWYKASPAIHSIYFYDPQYQRYLQQQSSNRLIFPSVRAGNQSPSHRKYTANSHNSSNNYIQKQIRPSRLQFVPILPPIIDYKKAKDQ